MTGPSSQPRGEKAPRPGVTWETELRWTGEHVIDDQQPKPRANHATRRAARRRKEK